jgi:GNAT superfamily N-acetyltransferase
VTTAAKAGQSPFLVRYAENWDQSLIQAWLPDCLHGTPGAIIGVAADAVTGTIAGMAYLRVFVDHCVRFRIFVLPAFRRRGCGALLFNWVRHEAVQANGTSLLTAAYYEPDPKDEATVGELAFFQALGLSPAQDLLRHKTEVATAIAVLEPLYRRATRAAKKDHEASIVTVDQADLRALTDFAVRQLGGFPEDVSARLRGAGRAYSPALSTAALIGNQVVGVLLIVPEADNGFIETRAVDPAHRGGWVNLAMMYCSAAAGGRLGYKTLDFEGEVNDKDTSRLAVRLRAATVGRRQSWGCKLSGTTTPPDAPAPVAAEGWRAEALRDLRVDGLDFTQLQERLFLDALQDVFHVMTERNLANLSAANHARGVSLQLRLERHGPEAFDRRSGLKHALLLMALPASAGAYVFDTLAAGLGLDGVAIGTSAFPGAVIDPRLAIRLSVPGTLCRSHGDARLGNLALVARFVDRLIVHVRDPRQAMLSTVHHLNKVHTTSGSNPLATLGPSLPADYFTQPLAGQIDWMIANGMPEFVRWLESWLDAAVNPLFGPRILFLRYEDLHADPQAYFAALLRFYGVAWRAPEFQPPLAATARHFRQGKIAEWRSVLNPAQQEAASALVPTRVLTRFGWPAR